MELSINETLSYFGERWRTVGILSNLRLMYEIKCFLANNYNFSLVESFVLLDCRIKKLIN